LDSREHSELLAEDRSAQQPGWDLSIISSGAQKNCALKFLLALALLQFDHRITRMNSRGAKSRAESIGAELQKSRINASCEATKIAQTGSEKDTCRLGTQSLTNAN
jgi:hypothetical protein